MRERTLKITKKCVNDIDKKNSEEDNGIGVNCIFYLTNVTFYSCQKERGPFDLFHGFSCWITGVWV